MRLDRYPHINSSSLARRWLTIVDNLGLSEATLSAYALSLEDYLRFVTSRGHDVLQLTREAISQYIRDLRDRPGRSSASGERAGLSNATIQQRLTVARMFSDFLIEEGLRQTNPVGRGRYTPGRVERTSQERGILPRVVTTPWIPSEDQWRVVIHSIRRQTVRTRTMFALSYECALRREEVCSLRIDDFDPSLKLLRVRAEVAKNRRERIVPYTSAVSPLLGEYLRLRRKVKSRDPRHLFLSESRRNCGKPLSIWSWSKTFKSIAESTGFNELTPHTLRHLRLTDLARADWDIHKIAVFAGHRSTSSTMIYIHLSGRDLTAALARGMGSVHESRLQLLTGPIATGRQHA
jgi:site-specific recombinase XerD